MTILQPHYKITRSLNVLTQTMVRLFINNVWTHIWAGVCLLLVFHWLLTVCGVGKSHFLVNCWQATVTVKSILLIDFDCFLQLTAKKPLKFVTNKFLEMQTDTVHTHTHTRIDVHCSGVRLGLSVGCWILSYFQTDPMV